MSVSMKTLAVVIVLAAVLLVISYGGIFGFITLSTQLQLLLQVLGIALIVLGVCACCFSSLNKSVDQADRP